MCGDCRKAGMRLKSRCWHRLGQAGWRVSGGEGLGGIDRKRRDRLDGSRSACPRDYTWPCMLGAGSPAVAGPGHSGNAASEGLDLGC